MTDLKDLDKHIKTTKHLLTILDVLEIMTKRIDLLDEQVKKLIEEKK